MSRALTVKATSDQVNDQQADVLYEQACKLYKNFIMS